MNCPRCQSRMLEVSIAKDSAKIELCPGCNGSFYQRAEFEAVLSMPRVSLERSPLRPILKAERLDGIALHRPVDCPVCGETMKRAEFSQACPVEVDVCVSHGIWLDDGELARVHDSLA